MMMDEPEPKETLIGRDQQSALLLRDCPEAVVGDTFFRCAPDIPQIVPKPAQSGDGHQRNMLIDEDLHASIGSASILVNCSSASFAA